MSDLPSLLSRVGSSGPLLPSLPISTLTITQLLPPHEPYWHSPKYGDLINLLLGLASKPHSHNYPSIQTAPLATGPTSHRKAWRGINNFKINKASASSCVWTSLVAQCVKNHLQWRRPSFSPWVQSQGWKDPLVKEMVTCCSILAWRIPCTKEPGRLQSMGSQRVRHNWMTDTSSWISVQFSHSVIKPDSYLKLSTHNFI